MAAHRLPDQEIPPDLTDVPQDVWAVKGGAVGLTKQADPVVIKLRPGAKLPRVPQYPLSLMQINGVRDQIKTFVNQGILVPIKSLVNTPLYPVAKPGKPDQFRLVHDLWAVNKIIQEDAPLAPNPYTILGEIRPDASWFSMIDLVDAFFRVPVHPDSQYLFAFTF